MAHHPTQCGRNIWGKAYTVTDVGAMYRWKSGEIRQKLQVTVKNIFDKTYVIVGGRVVGDKIGVYTTYSIER